MKSLLLSIYLFVALLSLKVAGQATINLNNQHQVIDGFGGSSAWSGKLSTAVMDALYKNGNNQLGFTIIRLRIDPNKSWADEKANANSAKLRGATVFATPWSPPASMKTNNNLNNGGQLKTTEYGNYTNYLNQFIDYVGTDLDIISLQNEPDWKPDYESCEWTGAQFLDFCKNYAGSLKRPVMFPETLGYNWALSDPTLNDPAAAKNVSYIGGHLYGSQPRSYTKALNLGKHVWMTEWYNDKTTADGYMVYAKQVLDCMYQNFSAYVYWWMTQSDGVISNGVPNKNGYILAQFAKYVRPGYYRVEATYNPQNGVYVVAFKGATKAVIVAVNNGTSAKTQQFSFQNGVVSSMSKYTTSFTKNIANDGTVTLSNGSFSSSLDAQSITTFVGDLGNVPSISFTSPAQNSVSTVGTPISLAATATITSGSIASVKFYDGTTLLNTDNSAPYTYSWTNATAGKHILRAVATDNLGNSTFDTLSIKVNVAQGPYGGTAWPIPGTIQSESYDVGGNGYAYSDDSPGNTGGATFRTDEDVDLENCTDAGGGYNLGFATAGEWLEYTVDVASAGAYDVDLRVAANGEGRTVSLSMDGTALGGTIAVPNTGGWQTWTTTTLKGLQLKQGQQVLRITVGATDYVNLNFVEFKSQLPTGLEGVESLGVQLSPNPFQSEGLEIKNGEGFNYRLCGVNGALLEEGKASDSKRVGQHLLPGIYFLTLHNEKGIWVEKIIRH